MHNLQPLLTPANGSRTDLIVSLSADQLSYDLYMGLQLFESIPIDPADLRYKITLARLVNCEIRSLRELARTFGHDCRTLRAWADALLSGDLAVMQRVLAGRGNRGKVTPQTALFVKAQFLALRHIVYDYRQRVAKAVYDVFGVSLSGPVLSGLFREARAEMGELTEDAEDAEEAEEAEEDAAELRDVAPRQAPRERDERSPLMADVQATVCPQTSSLGEDEAAAVKLSPAPCEAVVVAVAEPGLPLGMPISRMRPPAQPRLLHHAGLVLLAPWLDLVEAGASCLKSSWSCIRQHLGQLLQGAQNVEQSKRLCAGSLQQLLGAAEPNRDNQRAKLDELAADTDIRRALYQANIHLIPPMSSPPCLYVDVHTKEYFGGHKILQGYHGSTHRINKLVNLDCVHTEAGWPCYIRHADNFYNERERLFMLMQELSQLDFQVPGGFTFVVDRGYFGLTTFDAIIAAGADFIIWEKGYSEADSAWDDARPGTCFSMLRCPNSPRQTVTWEIAYQESMWPRNPAIRRLIVRITRPRRGGCLVTGEVSILVSHPTLLAERCIRRILRRWLQENDIRFLIINLGLDQLDSYRSVPYRQLPPSATPIDKPTVSSDYRAWKRQHSQATHILERVLRYREQAADSLHATSTAVAVNARLS